MIDRGQECRRYYFFSVNGINPPSFARPCQDNAPENCKWSDRQDEQGRGLEGNIERWIGLDFAEQPKSSCGQYEIERSGHGAIEVVFMTSQVKGQVA